MALSLRELQADLRDCGGADHCPGEVLHLGGLTEVLGYVEDPEDPRREIELAGSRRADYMNRRQGHE